MPKLLLGPMVRHIGETDATVWAETDRACEVDVLGRRERTFQVEGHHYAIVPIEGLAPGQSHAYEVLLDGERVWPDPDLGVPPSTIRTIDPQRRLRLIFGSCRRSGPHEPPWTRRRANDSRGLGIDALRTYALRAARQPEQEWPDLLLMLGDQIYADEPSPNIAEFVASHQPNPDAPRDQLEDFPEYAAAYGDAWSDPHVRWLLSTVPSAMIFDDHEIHDEWKISDAWVREMRAKDWYDRRVTAGLMTYWLYQHLGNVSPGRLAEDELLQAVKTADDGGDVLRAFARDADRQAARSRWSFCRDLGRTRLVVLDARGGRTLEPGRRRILTDAEWRWVERQAEGDFAHLLLASSIPFVVSHGLHWLEAWSERVCDGAWGNRVAAAAERFRQRANLGHWPAFQRSFDSLGRLLEDVAAGRRGQAPQSVIMLSGDVHHCYLAEVAFRAGSGARSPVWQAVCSGLRKQLDPREKKIMRLTNSRTGHAIGRLLARSVGVGESPLDWRLVEDPVYENQIATLELDDGQARVEVETTAGTDWRDPELRPVFSRVLAAG